MHNHAEKEWEGQRQEDRHLCCKQHEQIYRDGPACVVYSTLSMPSFWPQTIQKSFFVFLPSWFYVPWNNSNKYFKALFSEDTSKLFFRNICSGLVSLHPEVCPSLSQSLVQYKCFFFVFFLLEHSEKQVSEKHWTHWWGLCLNLSASTANTLRCGSCPNPMI